MSETIPTLRVVVAPSFVPGHEPAGDEEQAASVTPDELAAVPEVPGGDEPSPAGGALADLIAAGLMKRGWVVEYRWTTYEGHALDARRGEHRYDVEVVLDDAEQGAWKVRATRRTGFFKRIFKGGVDPAEHELLRRHIDEVVAADARTHGAEEGWLVEG